MNKVYKIVTARGSEFIEGFLLDSSEFSPRIMSVFPTVVGDMGMPVTYIVEFSNGLSVEVKDAVEVWSRPATKKEEEKMLQDFAKLP